MKDKSAARRESLRYRGATVGRRLSAAARAEPSFLIIGAQKAGTTSLFDYLAEHPAIRPPRIKEPHYFTEHSDRPWSSYLASFPLGAAMTGEATPYYLFHPFAPDRAARALPGVKLIVLLRDPVARAFSHHNHNVALGLEDLPFAAALEAETGRLAGAEADLRQPGGTSFVHQHHSYLARGMYAEQLQRWFARFARERFLILSSEDFFADPASGYGETLRFLELADHDPGPMNPRNARSYSDAMTPELRDRLRSQYAKPNQQLYDVVGRDFGW